MRAWLPILDTALSPSVRAVGSVSREKHVLTSVSEVVYGLSFLFRAQPCSIGMVQLRACESFAAAAEGPFITLFIAYMKDQASAVTVSSDFKISPSTPPTLVPPHYRELPLSVPTPCCSQLLPMQVDSLITLTLLVGDTSSETAAPMTTLPGLHFPLSLPPPLQQPQAPWICAYLLWCCWLPR